MTSTDAAYAGTFCPACGNPAGSDSEVIPEHWPKRPDAVYGCTRLAPNRRWPPHVVLFVVIARRVVGAVLFLTGLVWVGQGTNLIGGSSMTGSTFWAVMGALCIVAALGLLGWPWRQSRADA
jgi:hypothetical protein